ncbi:MAG TPA: hypothetical protein PLK99_01880 [Burkholderiales bacterium]|nr:hypothetical protein [Burkholderiales bacterium]
MKATLIAISLAAGLVSLHAQADVTAGGLLGAITGGLLGAQAGQGNGRVAASALGAVPVLFSRAAAAQADPPGPEMSESANSKPGISTIRQTPFEHEGAQSPK